MVKVMITNGGPHPADKWADTSTEAILDLLVDANPDSATPEAAAARAAKRNLRPVLFDIFNEHHDRVQKHERGELAKSTNPNPVTATIDVAPHLGVMDAVHAALDATPFAAHFARPEVRSHIKQLVGQHTADAMHIERSWHQDRLTEKGA